MSYRDSTRVNLDSLTPDQRELYYKIEEFRKSDQKMMSVTGYAGTGKTYMLNCVSDRDTGICAPTHKAVAVLKNKVNVYSFAATLHSALGLREQRDGEIIKFVPDRNATFALERLEDIDLLIVDESSMVDDTLFGYLDEYSDDADFKVLFMGDPFQIPPVNLGSVSIPCDTEQCHSKDMPTSSLTKIVRQAEGNPIIHLSMMVRQEGLDYVRANLQRLAVENEMGGVEKISKSDLGDLLDSLYLSPEAEDIDYVRTVAYTNKVVDNLNKLIRDSVMDSKGKVPTDDVMLGDYLVMSKPYLEGKKILLNNNDEVEIVQLEEVRNDVDIINDDYPITYFKATVKNLANEGTVVVKILSKKSEPIYKEVMGLLLAAAKSKKKGSLEATTAWKEFYQFQEIFIDYKHVFAITAHKSQGSTYNTTIIMLNDIMKCGNVWERDRIFYTAVTRASKKVYIVT